MTWQSILISIGQAQRATRFTHQSNLNTSAWA